MTTNYSNLPISSPTSEQTVQAFDAYYNRPIELNSTAYSAIVAFFTSRGFEQSASESITIILMQQAKQDGYNPMQILDTLRGISNVDLSNLVAEILNYNRIKTSSLGRAQKFTTNLEVARNIIP